MDLRNRSATVVHSVLLLVLAASFLRAEEGMFPISEIHKLDLRSKGIQLQAGDIYNPRGVSLIDAIVNIGGCTGAFVSAKGLILTNHHCAFPALQAASSPQSDYVTHGLLARTLAEEIPARGNTVRITESYSDVSSEILSAGTDSLTAGERSKAVALKIKEIVARTERQTPGRRAEVSEMFAGKSYLLFVYIFLKDVRLVYVPPRAIGEFGGEADNWIWPRHTGDFSFMRAYVGPDGAPAEYSPGNIPYRPRKFLKVQPSGANEEDPVFILGYPGRTYRHRTSHFLAYEESVRMPYLADLFEWQIAAMEEIGKNDRAVALKHDARIKSLANTSKNYRGKLLGMGRLNMVAGKREEERLLQQFIESDSSRKARYGGLFHEIESVFGEMESTATREFTLEYLRSSSALLSAGLTACEAVRERQKPDLERESAYMERSFGRTRDGVLLGLKNFYAPTERLFLKEMLLRASRLTPSQRIAELESIVGGADAGKAVDAYLATVLRGTRMADTAALLSVLSKSQEEVAQDEDPILRLSRVLAPVYKAQREARQVREGTLSKLYGRLADVKQQFLKTAFIPDANGTLRFTCGRIRGYAPVDATYFSPITTLRGVVEKSTGKEPFAVPEKLLELYRKGDFGRYGHPKLKSVPVALLYNLDTTGGNSGSPLLNAKGELVGVNFDRTFEATINDFAWNEEYSRSIGVDIRYVLWVTEKIGGATYLLEEMGV